jgi:hypothetical protein
VKTSLRGRSRRLRASRRFWPASGSAARPAKIGPEVSGFGKRRPRLLLVPPHPPRGAGLLGEPRRPPLLPALQPLDRAAPDLDADDGAAEVYLDRNYGGILIIWDRLFGSFQGETEKVRYGLTKNIRTFRPTKVAFHEFAAIWRDVRSAGSCRHRLGFLFRSPGWSPDGGEGGTRG